MSKHNNRNIVTNLSRATGLPLDLLGNGPLMHLYRDNELIVEGTKNLEHYDECCVRIRLDKSTVTVNGNGLCIRCLANNNLCVYGEIYSIALDRIGNG